MFGLRRHPIQSSIAVVAGLGLSVLAGACTSRSPEVGTGQMAWRVIAAGDHSGIVERRQVAANDIPEWLDIWSSHAAIFDPEPAAPAVAWDRERVSGFFLGAMPTAGVRIHVTGVRRVAGRVHVEATVDRSGATRLAVVTHPHCVLALPAGKEPVVWIVEGLQFQGRNASLNERSADPPGNTMP